MRYSEQAVDRAERFLPGAFQPLGVVSLNLQHDRFREIASTDGGSLRIEDTAAELRVEADLREGSAELSLVRRRALRGLSVEFRALAERRDRSGVRVIVMTISEIPQSRSSKFPTLGVLVSLVRASFRSLFAGLRLVCA